jgi:hypothetical protein
MISLDLRWIDRHHLEAGCVCVVVVWTRSARRGLHSDPAGSSKGGHAASVWGGLFGWGDRQIVLACCMWDGREEVLLLCCVAALPPPLACLLRLLAPHRAAAAASDDAICPHLPHCRRSTHTHKNKNTGLARDGRLTGASAGRGNGGGAGARAGGRAGAFTGVYTTYMRMYVYKRDRRIASHCPSHRWFDLMVGCPGGGRRVCACVSR